MKDCSDRKSFADEGDAIRFQEWERDKGIVVNAIWKCDRCGRWHLAGGRKQADYCQKIMKRERCITNLDLHLQMARVVGMSLEALQTKIDLSKITVSGGRGLEFFSVKRDNPFH